MKIKAVAFDLGGTLIDYQGLPPSWAGYYEEAFDQVRSKLSLDLDKFQIEAAITALRKYNTRINPREIEYSSDYIFSEVTQTWKLSNHSVNDIACCFYRFFQKRARVFQEAPTILASLHERKMKIGILTDSPPGIPDELVREAAAFPGCRIDCLLTSPAVGVRKPDVGGYLRLTEELGTNTSECIFVGDEEKDILGANKAGMISILIDRNQQNRDYGQAYTINSLREILTLEL
jgi:putative hydrolase of the HAD superfamily